MSPRHARSVHVASASQTLLKQARADQESVVSLVQALVRAPSRGGMDLYDEVVAIATNWLQDHDLPSRALCEDATGRTLGLVCDVAGEYPGPRYVLDACLDTAPFGDPAAWRHAPTSGVEEDGWLYGRGAADSKAAIAIFLHVARRLQEQASRLHGTLTLLLDADEHTGQFGGAKRYFGGGDAPRDIAGVMIGYPGSDALVIGGRGFLRANLTAHGRAGHTGSRHRTLTGNAVAKAADLVQTLGRHETPGPVDASLGLAPRITVTHIHGGEGFSIVPDRTEVGVDVRLTTTFTASCARRFLDEVIGEVDRRWPGTARTDVAQHESWPAFRLADDAPIRLALAGAAAKHLDGPVMATVAGPSNIGNYLAQRGIPATAGLGVRYEGLHGADERIDLSTIPAVQATYHDAVLSLLGRPT